jgi:hypothetical protein
VQYLKQNAAPSSPAVTNTAGAFGSFSATYGHGTAQHSVAEGAVYAAEWCPLLPSCHKHDRCLWQLLSNLQA